MCDGSNLEDKVRRHQNPYKNISRGVTLTKSESNESWQVIDGGIKSSEFHKEAGIAS